MIFCQACGSQNAPDARFCNMCGAPIAKVGTPGGPIDRTQLGVGLTPDTGALAGTNESANAAMPGYYPGGGNTMSVQLDAIGIRSTKKTWATLAGIALLVFTLGGVATFFTMRSAHEDIGGAAVEDPFEVGSPQIEGADEVDFVSGRRDGQGTPVPPTPTTPLGVTPTSPTDMGTPPSTTDMNPVVAANTTMSHTSTTPSTMTTTPTTMETTPATMETTPVTMEEPTTMETTPTDTPPEGEMEMEMYASRVRYLVRRYYLPRSQSCFEHATRNNPSLHGQVMVSLTIGPSGTVTSSSVARNSTGDTALGSCLATQVRSWQLTPPPGGESLTMTLPFSR